jgi:hypothetical protein
VADIRSIWKDRPTYASLAKDYKVSVSMIRKIIGGYRYKLTDSELDAVAAQMVEIDASRQFHSDQEIKMPWESGCTPSRS